MIQAWEEIYASQYRQLVTLMTALCGSVADAEEAVQEAFARGLGLSGRRPPPQDPAAWLYRVAANVVRGKWRRALVAHRHRSELAVEPPVASAADHTDDRLMLLAAMRGLPAEQRETLALHYLADLPIAAIADRMDVPSGTVKARLSRGRNALAAVLTRDIPPHEDPRSVRQPEFSAIRQQGARRARRRIAATAAILTVIVATGAVWGSSRLSRPEPITPTPSATPSTTPTPSPSPAARADVRNTTLTLPDPQFAEDCGKGGNLTFVDGAAKVGQATWSIGKMTPIEGDLDGVPGAELVTTLSCSEEGSMQLVALRAAPSGELSVLGYVLPSNTALMFDAAEVRIEAGVVQIATDGFVGHVGLGCAQDQVRGYAYRDGLFKQVSGATEFPYPPMEVRQIDLRNSALALTVRASTPGSSGFICVAMNEGTGTGTPFEYFRTNPVTYTFTIEPKGFVTGSNREFAISRVTYRAGGGPEAQSVQAISRFTDGFEGQTLADTGADGVTSIDDVKVNGNRVIVTVTVNGAKQTWTYNERPGSDVWARA